MGVCVRTFDHLHVLVVVINPATVLLDYFPSQTSALSKLTELHFHTDNKPYCLKPILLSPYSHAATII